MLQQSSTYSAKILREFKNLDQDNYHAVVHFYEEHEREIAQIGIEEHFILLASYINALHEIGIYQKVLANADQMLQYSIIYNIQFHQGEDIYLKTLFQKATAQLYTHDYPSAQHSLEQLINIQPNYKPFRKLLLKSLLRQRPLVVKRMFAFGVILYLLSVVMVVVNILLVQPYYNEFVGLAEFWRGVVFVLSILVLVIGEVAHHLNCRRAASRIYDVALQKKHNK
ncbi:MAG: hypothetical protein AAF502_03345 [Bacteroidota bacterium]